METSVIDQDLVRWSRRRWFWGVALVFGIQVGLLFSMTRPLQFRSIYPAEPVLELPVSSASKSSGEWLELEDPMLFAAPGWKGVSAMAWMMKPAVDFTLSRELPAIRYLDFLGAGGLIAPEILDASALRTAHRRPAPQPILPVLPPAPPRPGSRLSAEGFDERRLMNAPELPVQYHGDAVGRTVVQAAIDPEGTVLSSRVILPSGSKRADASALEIARALRFESTRAFDDRAGEIVWGKLIFEWHALSLNSTNAVRR